MARIRLKENDELEPHIRELAENEDPPADPVRRVELRLSRTAGRWRSGRSPAGSPIESPNGVRCPRLTS